MAIRRRRWRVRANGSGFDLNLPAEERQLLANLLPQLREVMEHPDDERARRLFPTAYTDDVERDAEYHRFMREELVASRVAALETFARTAESKHIDEAALLGWMQCVNGVRLVLGTLLDVSEDDDLHRLDENDPHFAEAALYGYLSGLLEEIVQALSRG
ncbi:unannotated protein [freshwater metagenome]|uniref:Unannotated protein n=1 Tax=freshwater metagenome TaxID=449393 RepID=A0A6J6X5W6_9ZZZZ